MTRSPFTINHSPLTILTWSLPLATLALTAACTTETPTMIQTALQYSAHLPIAARHSNPPPLTSPKKGVVFFGDPRALGPLGPSWAVISAWTLDNAYTLPTGWPSDVEPVLLLTHATPIERAINNNAPLPTKRIMLWNEPDLWHIPTDNAAALTAELIRKHPNHEYILLNLAGSLQYALEFSAAYDKLTGKPWPDGARLGYHCYNPAHACIARLHDAKTIARTIGAPSIWLTEFGTPLGIDTTMKDRARDLDQLIAYMERDAAIERYAYFATMLPDNLCNDIADPTIGWIPLAYQVFRKDEIRLSYTGKWYAYKIPLVGTMHYANNRPTVGRIANPAPTVANPAPSERAKGSP